MNSLKKNKIPTEQSWKINLKDTIYKLEEQMAITTNAFELVKKDTRRKSKRREETKQMIENIKSMFRENKKLPEYRQINKKETRKMIRKDLETHYEEFYSELIPD